MMVLLIFIALLAAYVFGIVSMLGAVKRASPAAYYVLVQDMRWRRAERKAGRDKEGEL